MINREDWSEEEVEIFALFGYRCVRCGEPSEVLHEDIPKSRRPKTWMEKGNRSPLCIFCHDWAHRGGTRNSARELKELKKDYLDAHNIYS
jgi:hypothetical protein